jgi:hypothetical protein
MIKRFSPMLVALLLLANIASAQDNEESAADSLDVSVAISDAIAAAEFWLAIVDSAGWPASYTEASQLFKSAVAPDVWIRQIRAARTPFGPFIARSLSGSHYATSLPGAPDGEYVVLTYQAEFANKKAAVETITPMRDTDGNWRVSGYYVK